VPFEDGGSYLDFAARQYDPEVATWQAPDPLVGDRQHGRDCIFRAFCLVARAGARPKVQNRPQMKVQPCWVPRAREGLLAWNRGEANRRPGMPVFADGYFFIIFVSC